MGPAILACPGGPEILVVFFVVFVLPAALVVLAIVGTARGVKRNRLDRLADRRAWRICVRCGYDLRATPERCPECGTVVTGVYPLPPAALLPSGILEWCEKAASPQHTE